MKKWSYTVPSRRADLQVMGMKKKRLLYSSVLFFSILSTSFAFNHFAQGQTQIEYGVEVAFPQLSFNQPVGILNAGNDANRLFVVEQIGIIHIFDNSNVSDSQVFLNITEKVLFGGEQGLLGLAFHPDYLSNGYFYVNYVAANPTRTVIARYSVSLSNPNQVDENSEQSLLEISQPFSNHNGGQLAFGPDGYLYIATGDGGSQGDPFGNSQNLSTLLGKILRIDVDGSTTGQAYGIPADNPYVGNIFGYREEIYAHGLRNPWRFSFDALTGQIWAGDAGQNQREEIDIIEKGKNYGWNIMEGTQCYNPSVGCNQNGLALPAYEYDHSLGNAIIGGFVYRGSALAELYGRYIYGDYGSGRIWALATDGSSEGDNMLLIASGLLISSFGVDKANELYICAFDGKIYRLTITIIPELSVWASLILIAGVSVLIIIVIKKRLFTSISSDAPAQCSL